MTANSLDNQSSSFFAAVAGNIGVGKTTLTRRISQEFGFEPYYEKVIKNPYLQDFYSDMQRWSFHLQVYFLSQRFNDHRRMILSPRPCVQDRTIYEDAEIFAAILHKNGNMTDRDYSNYLELFSSMTDFLRKPDLIIYLKASVWTLTTRIRKRGRDYERNISTEYLYELNDAYNKWIARIENDFNVLVINADSYDFEENRDSMDSILKTIKNEIGTKTCQVLGL
ncbi:MAG: deoxynucleoside kinase [candidate division KSB1 bacterium]|nr:deoxynucleoside kinase [candidate division KSB1 bacterium]